MVPSLHGLHRQATEASVTLILYRSDVQISIKLRHVSQRTTIAIPQKISSLPMW